MYIAHLLTFHNKIFHYALTTVLSQPNVKSFKSNSNKLQFLPLLESNVYYIFEYKISNTIGMETINITEIIAKRRLFLFTQFGTFGKF